MRARVPEAAAGLDGEIKLTAWTWAEPRLSGTPYRMLHLRTPDSQGRTGKVQADENSSQRTSQTVTPSERPGRKACALEPNGSLSLPTDVCHRLMRTATLPAVMLVPRGGTMDISAVFS